MKSLVESAERYLEEDETPTTQSQVKLFVDSIIKEVVEDNYEQGEIGNGQLQMDEKIGKTFDSFDAFKKYAEKLWYFRPEEDYWTIIDNRIIYQRQENDNGDEVVSTDPEYKKFVANQMNLWSATYDFLVELIVPSKTDEDAIRAFTGIKN